MYLLLSSNEIKCTLQSWILFSLNIFSIADFEKVVFFVFAIFGAVEYNKKNQATEMSLVNQSILFRVLAFS